MRRGARIGDGASRSSPPSMLPEFFRHCYPNRSGERRNLNLFEAIQNFTLARCSGRGTGQSK
jgi:hypothetical protein